MPFVDYYHEITGNRADQLEQAIAQALALGVKSIIILTATQAHWSLAELNPLLLNCPVPIFGGIFPLVITKSGCHTDKTLVLGLQCSFKLAVINDLSSQTAYKQTLVNSQFSGVTKNTTLMVFVDGLAKNVERLVEDIYDVFGAIPNTIGGGAGALDFIQRPCVITPQGVLSDAALIAYSDVSSYPAFAHGWEVLDGPFLITEAAANTVQSINFLPAFEFYKARIEALSNHNFAQQEFFDIAKNFPLGIASIDSDILVRDPLKRLDNDLFCVGELPQNSTVYLLQGDVDGLIQASGAAATQAYASYDVANGVTQKETFALIFDCISRQLFLGEQYPRVLDKIQTTLGSRTQIFGVLSLGEIANSICGPIELLNKTTLIAIFS